MHEKLKRMNRKRLASLSALGAGALGVAACPANANDIVFSGVIDVGYPYTIPGPNGAGGALGYNPGCQLTCASFGHGTYIVSHPGKYGTQFRLLATGPRNSWALGEPQGAVWGTAPGKSTKSAGIISTFDGRAPYTKFTSTDRYMLFRFRGGRLKHDFYGWARMQINRTYGYMEIVDWAYDPSGVHIPAGYHGSGQVEPEDLGALEPSTTDAPGLSALALGAPGVRHWRAARAAEAAKAAASDPAR
jgi:hypothetical protein